MTTASDIEIRHLPAQTIAYQRLRAPLASVEIATQEVRSWAVTMGYQPRGPMVVEIHGEPADAGAEQDFEVQLPVDHDARANPTDMVQIRRQEPADAAVMTVRGASDILSLQYPLGRLRDWMRGRDARGTGVVRWVEITDPATASADEMLSEIQEILEPGAAAGPAPASTAAERAAPHLPASQPSPPPSTAGPSPIVAGNAPPTAPQAVPPETRPIAYEAAPPASPAQANVWQPEEPGQGRSTPWWAIAAIVAALIGVLVGGIITYRRREKQRDWTNPEHWKQMVMPSS